MEVLVLKRYNNINYKFIHNKMLSKTNIKRKYNFINKATFSFDRNMI